MAEEGRPLPLDGVTVVDLSQIYDGPYATFLMAAGGAHVIKVEPPGGESLRRRGAIATALYGRERTGLGRRVEVAMLDAVCASLASSLGLHYGSGGRMPPRTGNRHGGLAEAPYNVYPTRDGHVAIICVGDVHWRSLLAAMGRDDLADDPRFASLEGRIEHVDEIDGAVSAWTAGFDKQSLFELLQRHRVPCRVPCAPVRELDEVVNDPHLHARGMLQRQDHPELGPVVVQHSPLRDLGSGLRPLEPSRPLGADAVLGERLGRGPKEIAALRDAKVI